MEQQAKPRTIEDLATLLGVSTMTVHRAISGKPDISPKTRARILAEIERLDWRPNIAARGLRQGKTFTLGILVSNVAASFLPEILQGVNQAAEAKNYHAFVSVHEHEAARAIRHLQTLQSKGVDGIVHYPTLGGGEIGTLNDILRNTPTVAVMRAVPDFEGPVVLVDDVLGGRLAARHLLGLGHRRIGFLGYHDADLSHLRRQGFEEALRENGEKLRSAWTLETVASGASPSETDLDRLLGGAERPTAIFCPSDRLAARVVQGAADRGLRVPEDVSVMGYNGDAWAALLPVPLTTVAQPRAEIGERAAQMVLEERTGGRSCTLLEPWLVARASTAPAPGNTR